jgi:hypothetical protein
VSEALEVGWMCCDADDGNRLPTRASRETYIDAEIIDCDVSS